MCVETKEKPVGQAGENKKGQFGGLTERVDKLPFSA